MHRTLIGSIAGALTSLALIAPLPASAATSPTVFVRVEGSAATLLPQTTMTTSSATTVRGQTCPGASALGALDTATDGNWAGSFNSSFKDYFVTGVMGETSTGNNFWSLWVNGRSSTTGGCSTALQPGDRVLWFDCVADANFNCTNNPLSLVTPTVLRRGTKVTATVTQLDGSGHSTPITGAAISGGGVAAVSGASGATSLIPRKAGVFALEATKSGATPSDPVYVCVYATRKSDCASFATSGPAVRINGIREHAVLSKPPRTLTGTATANESGLTDVELSLKRTAPNGKCSYLDPKAGTFHRISCHGKPIPSVSLGAAASWQYLLPSALQPGKYTLDVIASDGAGRHTKLVTGSSSIDFTVVKAHK
jgi:hypothetical protein